MHPLTPTRPPIHPFVIILTCAHCSALVCNASSATCRPPDICFTFGIMTEVHCVMKCIVSWTHCRHFVHKGMVGCQQPPPLWSCFAPFHAPISLSVCLIAGDGHVVYLTQNRTPLLFQPVEPPSPTQDGGPGLNNALPPPETTETMSKL